MATKQTADIRKETAKLEDDFSIEVKLNSNDVRFIFYLEDFQKLNKKFEKDRASDEDGLKLAGVIKNLLSLLVGSDGLDEIIEYYVERDDEFSIEEMTNVFTKVFESVNVQKK